MKRLWKLKRHILSNLREVLNSVSFCVRIIHLLSFTGFQVLVIWLKTRGQMNWNERFNVMWRFKFHKIALIGHIREEVKFLPERKYNSILSMQHLGVINIAMLITTCCISNLHPHMLGNAIMISRKVYRSIKKVRIEKKHRSCSFGATEIKIAQLS